MDIILIPGLWLDGSSWEKVVPVLEQAGHRTHPITLPGMESQDADRSGITLRDHVDAVIAAIDSVDPADGKVVLVGSGRRVRGLVGELPRHVFALPHLLLQLGDAGSDPPPERRRGVFRLEVRYLALDAALQVSDLFRDFLQASGGRSAAIS